MSRRASSFRPLMSGVACFVLATVAVGLEGPAQAECITQPEGQPPEGTHWSLHVDHEKHRRCWILVDASGNEVEAAPPPAAAPATPSFISSLQTFFGKLTGGPPDTPPPPHEAPAAAAPVAPPRKPLRRVANASHPARHGITRAERDALFKEFLRWKEKQKTTGAVRPPASQ